MSSTTKKAIPTSSSFIPGQTSGGDTVNIQSMLLAMSAGILMFLTSLTWSQFLDAAVQAIHKATGERYPLVVSRLITALIVSATVIFIFSMMYSWEKKVAVASSVRTIPSQFIDNEEQKR